VSILREEARGDDETMSDNPPELSEGWWMASDGKWYPPERHPNYQAADEPVAAVVARTVVSPDTQVPQGLPQVATDATPVLGRREAKQAEKDRRAKEQAVRRGEEAKQEATRKSNAAKAQRAKDFAQSPAGLARSAHEAKLPIFQWECDLSASTLKTMGMAANYGGRSNNVSQTSYSTQVNLYLAAIEGEGWRMTAMSTAFIPHSEVSRDKILSSGQETAISGRVQAVYVFHPFPAYSA
jgi:hypothetical protein